LENHDYVKRWLTAPGGLASRLQALRQRRELTSAELADTLGWRRPKVTKIEKGDQLPGPDEIRAWAGACGAPADVTERLIRLRGESHRLHLSYRGAATGPPAQALYAQLMESSRTAVLVETVLIPGPLQVADYARAILTMAHRRNDLPLDRLDDEVAERLSRARFIGAPGLELSLLLHETALAVTVGSPATMLAQLDRLHTIVDHPTVRFGIVPFTAPLVEVPRAFGIYDDFVITETLTGDLVHSRADHVDRFRAVAERLWSMAAQGPAARHLINTAAEHHRAG
jgi:transcriptional regulator with XRE-family HTH domain